MKKQNEIQIDGRVISLATSPYVIAEISANHNGSIETAFEIIREAKLAGADAVKLQTYLPSTITLDSDLPDFQIKDGLWAGKTLYQLYDSAYTPWEWHEPLFKYAEKLGITIFSSPFDNTAVDLLEDLNAPAYKIASFEAIDIPLIRYVANTRKPMIISTGMANSDEIEEAVSAAKDGGCDQLAILHCVSGYPALPSEYNLRTITDIAKRYDVVVGLSDHTLCNTTALTSIALGASIIEKHVTLDRKGGGPDDSFSLEPIELKHLCEGVGTAWAALGRVEYQQKPSEKENVIFRRSLYCVRDIRKGEVITSEHIKSIRPGYGVAPKFYDEIVGKKAAKDIMRGVAINWSSIES